MEIAAMSNPSLTVGMACFDDFDGVYFTVTSLMIHHSEAMRDCEIVVIDNQPRSRHGKLVRTWMRSRVPNGKYYAFEDGAGTAQPRNELFRRARGQAVLCLDCHVLLVPGAVRKLIDYYKSQPFCRDLLQGPLITDSGRIGATHQEPVWRSGAWGIWSIDDRGQDPQGEPFEIWQQGMGLFTCRKDAWVGFHPQFRGFGGCETYIMEKFRRNGGRVLCCPWLRWTHRFKRANGAPYRVTSQDKLRNYVIGFSELGLSLDPALEHFGVSRQRAANLVAATQAHEPVNGVAVVGSRPFAGVKMRGHVLAKHLGCHVISPEQLAGLPHCNTIIAIKSCNPALVRAKCDRLIYDPLDAFCFSRREVDCTEYWRSKYQELPFDDILATSPACLETMRAALPPQVRVHLVPHQCDHRIREDWRDLSGPVVYVGLRAFIKSGLDRVAEACRMIGKEFVVSQSYTALKGASLALALRLPPFNSPLYRFCKPQIKLENAAAARLPVVATDCPASISLHPGIERIPVHFSASELARAMRRAIGGPGLSNPFTNQQYLAVMDRILDRPSQIVYTAIFGGYDKLREPREKAPGVQYICFTDNRYLKSNVWQIRYCKPSGDPLFQAKRIKVLAHEILDCDMSLWIDGRIELHDLNGVFDRFRHDLALQKHTTRNCIYEEARFTKEIRRGNPARIDEAIKRYKAAGHPTNGGLWLGGIVLRRHSPSVTAFNNAWWHEINSGTSRDQIILPFILRRMDIRFEILPADTPRHHRGRHLNSN
jgi:hypothetical protein